MIHLFQGNCFPPSAITNNANGLFTVNKTNDRVFGVASQQTNKKQETIDVQVEVEVEPLSRLVVPTFRFEKMQSWHVGDTKE